MNLIKDAVNLVVLENVKEVVVKVLVKNKNKVIYYQIVNKSVKVIKENKTDIVKVEDVLFIGSGYEV